MYASQPSEACPRDTSDGLPHEANSRKQSYCAPNKIGHRAWGRSRKEKSDRLHHWWHPPSLVNVP
jgi:hypothetical protein